MSDISIKDKFSVVEVIEPKTTSVTYKNVFKIKKYKNNNIEDSEYVTDANPEDFQITNNYVNTPDWMKNANMTISNNNSEYYNIAISGIKQNDTKFDRYIDFNINYFSDNNIKLKLIQKGGHAIVRFTTNLASIYLFDSQTNNNNTNLQKIIISDQNNNIINEITDFTTIVPDVFPQFKNYNEEYNIPNSSQPNPFVENFKRELIINYIFNPDSDNNILLDEYLFQQTNYRWIQTIYISNIYEIGNYCFYRTGNHGFILQNSNLVTNIKLENIYRIGTNCFDWIKGASAQGDLTKSFGLTIENIDIIDEYCFAHNYCLKNAIIKNVNTINKDAFYSCQNLISVELTNINVIGILSFNSNRTLRQVTLTNVKKICQEAFDDGIDQTRGVIIINQEEPPILEGQRQFPNNIPIKVPADKVNLYKTSWPDYANLITSI